MEASKDKTVRHQLNPGGNRKANHALWRIVMVGLSDLHGPTIDFLERRHKEGKRGREIIRRLKRSVARTKLYRPEAQRMRRKQKLASALSRVRQHQPRLDRNGGH